MRNTGTRIWTNADRIRLGSAGDDTRWGVGRVPLPTPVRPGEQVTFDFAVTAPPLPAPFQWRMLSEGVGWFGDSTPPTVIAAPATPVRYGAALALRHLPTGRALHSHLHNWAHPGGSDQQQVTCYAGGDANDEWRVKGPNGEPLPSRAGTVVADGDLVRLEHVATRRNLHSHSGFVSPVTGQQEVTCFGTDGIGDDNDNWQVQVDGGGQWLAGRRVRLVHLGTGVALHSHVDQSSPVWTFGQQEVTGYSGADFNDWWSVSDLRARDALMASAQVPATLVSGQAAPVSIVVVNVGTSEWPAGGSVRLGSQDPQDNQRWGLNRVAVPISTAPGATATFTFAVTGPQSFGRSTCRWRMLAEGVEWFGETSAGAGLVISDTSPTTVPDVVGMERVPAGNAVRAAELVPQFSGWTGNNAAEVSNQSPGAGSSAPRGSVVKLTLRRP